MPFNLEEKPKLGEMLLADKLITAEQLKTALEYQKTKGGRLGEILEDLGFVDGTKLIECIAQQQELSIVNLEELVLPENLIKKIPRELIEKYKFLPIGFRDDVLTIAHNDPTDYEMLGEIQLATNWRIEVALAPRHAIQKAIKRIFHPEESTKAPKKKSVPAKAETVTTEPRQANKELNALIQLLIEKGIITSEELKNKLPGTK